ncbi:MAG TPA: hypothetical protein VFA18_21905 [Gemmataceae bacterium]|nr:hypothetical protein [Gemmataceae bacterium]
MRVFVASDDQLLSQRAREMLEQDGHECEVCPLVPVELAANRLARAQAEMLLVAMTPNPDAGQQLLEAVTNTVNGPMLAIGSAGQSKVRLRALQAGADFYLDDAELEGELAVILGRLRAQPRQAAPEPQENGKLISVLGPSGGSGSSTLAVNLATLLAREHKSCGLIDLRLGGGDLAALLDLKPSHTIADLCRNSARMDRTMFEHSLAKHDSGVQLLSPPRTVSEIGLVNAQAVRQALAMARAMFPYVVVDLDDAFHSEQAQTLKLSEVILLVLRLDFTSLRNTRRTLDHLEQLGISRDIVRLVVNRYGQPAELPVAKVEQALNTKIFHYVPDDPKTINRANNNGVPAVLEAPSAKFTKSMSQLATSVNGKKTR